MSRPVELTCVLSDHLPAIAADAPQIQQAIMNLVTNAAERWKAVPEPSG